MCNLTEDWGPRTEDWPPAHRVIRPARDMKMHQGRRDVISAVQRGPMSRAFITTAMGVLVTLAASAQQQPSRAFALTHTNVIDVAAGAVRRDMTVVIDGAKITAVSPAAGARVPADAQVVDGTGKYLIPGLWDMHVHWYDDRLLSLFIANGVTGIRQMWGMPMHFTWRDRTNSGALLSPRLSIASTIVDGPNPVWQGSIAVSNAAEARSTVRRIKDEGFDFVKVYERLPREAYFAIATEAKMLGIPFAGHVPRAIAAIEASNAGQRSIEHLSGVLYGASAVEYELIARRVELAKSQDGKPIEAAARATFRELNERALATYDEKKASALFAAFVRNGTWHCPTLTVLRSMASLDDPAFTSDARLKYMPSSIRNSWVPKSDFRLSSKGPDDYALDRRILSKQMELVGAMRGAGVKMIAGTDVLNPFAFPGFSLHDELGLLVKAGLTPREALQAATVNAAAYLDQSALAGTIEAGKIADVVLLDANPLENIANTKGIASVVLNGRLFDRQQLDAMLAEAERVANTKE
jgi:imidazolonepropionase-like amidohydrolase